VQLCVSNREGEKMKKIVTILTLFFITTALAIAKSSDDKEIIAKLGVQPQNTTNTDGTDENMNVGISAGAEFFKYFGNIFAFGAGALIDLPRNFKDKNLEGSLSCIPLYVGAKIRTPLSGLDDTYAFLSGRVGYSMPMTKGFLDSATGGLYWAAGLGVNINCIIIEAVYARHNFNYAFNSVNRDANYSTITLYVGFNFE
jgi:hypothetical protein